MSYKIKEIFYTLQGEGGQTGRAAVFCRFTGCNLWTGREKDREKAICKFCDTDFVGTNGLNGGRFKTAADVAAKVNQVWEEAMAGQNTKNMVLKLHQAEIITEGGQNIVSTRDKVKKYVVCTGGEPALQLDAALVKAFHDLDFEIAIETNGTIPLAHGIDWVCVSPKAGTDIVVLRGSELKLVFPQAGAEPEKFADLVFDNFYIQPMDSPLQKIHTQMALQYCLHNPQWKLSLQTHKILEIP
ncbi:MAG: 7-carboxy-7-deazaguanine synthase [Saprospiraceae bacterium]|nr:7-carboxy-7-deazaguanine synthase [Saprospiraceae bacterium]